MSEDVVSEFSFLPEQAALLGVQNVLAMRRVSVPTVEGRTISALRYGDESPTVTLLHGAGLNAHTFDTTLLSMGLSALVIDLPGHGDSSWREDASYTPANLATDVIIAMDQLTDHPQILVGHSLGGMTAAAVAATRPDLVARLVLVDIVPGLDPKVGPAQLRDFYSRLDFASRDELVDYAMSFGLGGDKAATARGVFFNSRIRPDGRVEWKHHFARIAREILPTNEQDGNQLGYAAAWENLEATTAPITLIRGEHGYIGDEALAEFARRLPAAHVETVASGHNVQETQPHELAHIITALHDA